MRHARYRIRILLFFLLLGMPVLGCDTVEDTPDPALGGHWEGEGEEGILTLGLELNLQVQGIDVSGNGTLQISDLGPSRQVPVIADGTYEYPSVDIAITGNDGSLFFLNAQMEPAGSAFSGTLRKAGGDEAQVSITMMQ
jgi:hypothetical protein